MLRFHIDPSVLRGPLLGHTDAVWGLAYSAAHQRLLSCSADGTLRLWNTAEAAPALTVFNDNQGIGFSRLFYKIFMKYTEDKQVIL